MQFLALLLLLAGLAPLAAAKGHHPLWCCRVDEKGWPFGCFSMWREWEFIGKNPSCVLRDVRFLALLCEIEDMRGLLI